MKISVTQKHIANGTPNSCGLCPIALAVMDATQADSVSVGLHNCCFQIGKLFQSYDMPETASRFIVDFDNGCKVSPFEFEATKRYECII